MWGPLGKKKKREGGGQRIQVYKKKPVHNELKVVLLHFLLWVWAEEEIPKYHQENYSHSIPNLAETREVLTALQKGGKNPIADPVSSILLIGRPTKFPNPEDLGRPRWVFIPPLTSHLYFLQFTDHWWHLTFLPALRGAHFCYSQFDHVHDHRPSNWMVTAGQGTMVQSNSGEGFLGPPFIFWQSTH